MKYRTDKPIKVIADALNEEITSMEASMRTKLVAYSSAKASLQAANRKRSGNLGARSLVGVVKKHHLVVGSEYLLSVVIAVPK